METRSTVLRLTHTHPPTHTHNHERPICRNRISRVTLVARTHTRTHLHVCERVAMYENVFGDSSYTRGGDGGVIVVAVTIQYYAGAFAPYDRCAAPATAVLKRQNGLDRCGIRDVRSKRAFAEHRAPSGRVPRSSPNAVSAGDGSASSRKGLPRGDVRDRAITMRSYDGDYARAYRADDDNATRRTTCSIASVGPVPARRRRQRQKQR